MDYQREFDLMCQLGSCSGVVDGGEIKRVEVLLGLKFPTEFRDVLSTYGAIIAPGFEIYGILPEIESGESPLWQDIVYVKNKLKSWNQFGSQLDNLVPISENGFGDYIYVDASVYPATRIAVLGPNNDKYLDVSIYEFFVKLSKGELGI